MTELADLVNVDLSAYRVGGCFEVQKSRNEFGPTYAKPECFTSEEVAEYRAKGASWYGGDGKVVKIFVLVTADEPAIGIALSGMNSGKTIAILRDSEETLRAAREILARLSPEERAILGHPDPVE